ncbi:hypothetical protein PHABIO_233 [Pseudomonas phage Phabio]|uniref:Uncharacterized protein n=1 Tax=Pseudomonas phage Phabio TaxID=2006668 RepID=A0A1Y0SWB0_9CAUD|nr:hypothetical protein MZD05_gp233 [Pseudomonas phage Phabio]ARV76864.1 hypothetical protein PHABIO_233 [Pseudomonas phage Phabio]
MDNNLIPSIGKKGVYKLDDPFGAALQPLEIYELSAIRYFDDIENNGGNVFDLYYKPFGLTEADVQTDRQNRVAILTLLTPKYPPLYVPTSYVVAYPNMDSKPYSQFVLTLSLGPLPNDVILEPAKIAVANAVSDFLGVTPEVFVGVMPLSDVVTPEDDENREVTRQAAILNRTTDYARLREANATIATLNQQIKIYEKICTDNGYIP